MDRQADAHATLDHRRVRRRGLGYSRRPCRGIHLEAPESFVGGFLWAVGGAESLRRLQLQRARVGAVQSHWPAHYQPAVRWGAGCLALASRVRGHWRALPPALSPPLPDYAIYLAYLHGIQPNRAAAPGAAK